MEGRLPTILSLNTQVSRSLLAENALTVRQQMSQIIREAFRCRRLVNKREFSSVDKKLKSVIFLLFVSQITTFTQSFIVMEKLTRCCANGGTKKDFITYRSVRWTREIFPWGNLLAIVENPCASSL